MRPLVLAPNQLRRFYRGGAAIARFRGIPATDDHAPEDWVGSTTTAYGEPELGLGRFADGTLVRDALAADPDGFLGAGRSDPGLLVKLLDAGERLPVHCHPDREFARRHFGSRYGKTEAWVIVEPKGTGVVRVGFATEVDSDTLARWVERQDVEAMLAALNEVPVAGGEVVYVPAGVPHAIDAGVFMIELQEPSDLSVLLEWPPADGDTWDLGLGPDTALAAVDRSAWPGRRLDELIRRPGERPRERLLPSRSAAFFGAERLRPAPKLELEPGFSILVVLDGEGQLEYDEGHLDLARGLTVLVPHGAGRCRLRGGLDVIRCLPPERSVDG